MSKNYQDIEAAGQVIIDELRAMTSDARLNARIHAHKSGIWWRQYTLLAQSAELAILQVEYALMRIEERFSRENQGD